MLITQLHPTLCDPIDCSLPGCSVHGSLQARILEWVAIPFSRGSSQPRDQTHVSCIAGRFYSVSSHQGSILNALTMCLGKSLLVTGICILSTLVTGIHREVASHGYRTRGKSSVPFEVGWWKMSKEAGSLLVKPMTTLFQVKQMTI